MAKECSLRDVLMPFFALPLISHSLYLKKGDEQALIYPTIIVTSLLYHLLMDINNNVRPRRRVIRRRPPPLEGYYYYLSLLKALVQLLSYVICMIIVAGIEIRIAEMLNSNPWMNRSQAHPPEQFFINRMDEVLYIIVFDI